jgi:hypothetical protein
MSALMHQLNRLLQPATACPSRQRGQPRHSPAGGLAPTNASVGDAAELLDVDVDQCTRTSSLVAHGSGLRRLDHPHRRRFTQPESSTVLLSPDFSRACLVIDSKPRTNRLAPQASTSSSQRPASRRFAWPKHSLSSRKGTSVTPILLWD